MILQYVPPIVLWVICNVPGSTCYSTSCLFVSCAIPADLKVTGVLQYQ